MSEESNTARRLGSPTRAIAGRAAWCEGTRGLYPPTAKQFMKSGESWGSPSPLCQAGGVHGGLCALG